MPTKPRKSCLYPGCRELIATGSYCDTHRPPTVDRRPSANKRGYGVAWVRVRNAFLRQYPTCAKCGDKATEAHHIQPLAEGGDNSYSNLMPLCKRCHSRITASHIALEHKTSEYREPIIG